MRLDDPTEILGVNSRSELADVAALLRDRKNDELMAAGVTIVDPATTWIEPDVTVGADTVLHPGVYLEGRTTVGAGCEIHSGVRIVDSVARRRRVREQLLRDRGVARAGRRDGSDRSRTSGRSPTSASRRTSATSSS